MRAARSAPSVEPGRKTRTNELRQAGIELIGGRQGSESGHSWQHFRAPDGKVFELCHDPER